ncbi:MAG: DegT/DnrJ/EryC1/StrS family aminotransferase [Muribaculum sp.]|nr:DegT/DnrJ/EryC1/StrS family aminotransferase [Muribaculum sp.]
MKQFRKIPFSPPDMSEEEVQEVAEALRSGWITTGPKTKEFERMIAAYCGTDRAVCLNSATASMEMALRMLGVGPGDEVIIPAYTYTSTASAVCHVGAHPVMIDCSPGCFEMDYDKMAAAVNEHTKVIMPVDLAGMICDYDRVFKVVEEKRPLFRPESTLQSLFNRIVVIADAAHAFGSEKDGKRSGQFADFTSFSFHAVKNLTTAEGGALTWKSRPDMDNECIYNRLQLLSLHGQNKDALAKTKLGSWEYDIIGPWYKCNMTDIMAGIGQAQLRRYPGMLKRRNELIMRYNKALEGFDVKVLPHYEGAYHSNGHLYLVRLSGLSEQQRNAVIEAMTHRGVATNVHFKPLPMMTAYRNIGYDIKDFPNAYAQYSNCMTLPLYTRLSDEDVDYILENYVEVLKEFGLEKK